MQGELILNITAKAISDMIKIRCAEDIDREAEKKDVSALLGEHFAYQTAVTADELDLFKISVHSEIEKYITAYFVKDVIMDFPAYPSMMTEIILQPRPGQCPTFWCRLHSKTAACALSRGISFCGLT